MGHKNNKTLVRQVQERFDVMLKIGGNKHQDKLDGVANQYIYSWDTYRSYIKHANYFVKWCKQRYGCRTLDACKPHAAEWMQTRQQLSAYTQKLEASALAKLYGCSPVALGVKTSATCRAAIKRSRGNAVRDKNFNEVTHADFVEFCRSIGCRRSELTQLRGDALRLYNGCWCICFDRGTKGGRVRYAPICGNIELVRCVCTAAGQGKVIYHLWASGQVPTNADIHSYRADYATRVYRLNARPIEQLQGVREWYGKVNRKGEHVLEPAAYRMRRDRAGEVFDRRAMLIASQALGHNRVSVVADHYLRPDELF